MCRVARRPSDWITAVDAANPSNDRKKCMLGGIMWKLHAIKQHEHWDQRIGLTFFWFKGWWKGYARCTSSAIHRLLMAGIKINHYAYLDICWPLLFPRIAFYDIKFWWIEQRVSASDDCQGDKLVIQEKNPIWDHRTRLIQGNCAIKDFDSHGCVCIMYDQMRDLQMSDIFWYTRNPCGVECIHSMVYNCSIRKNSNRQN